MFQLHRLGPLVVLLIGVLGLLGSVQLSLGSLGDPGPGLWPFITALGITVTAAALLVTDRSSDYEVWDKRSLRIAGGVASLVLFVIAFQLIGFFIPATLMLLLWLRVFGREPWRLSIILAATGALAFYLIFAVVLGVPFPEGPLSYLLAFLEQ